MIQIQVKPQCGYFGECGGCAYQNLSYKQELAIKDRLLQEIFAPLKLKSKMIESIIPSPDEYHYRNRLDFSFRKTLKGEYLLGFKSEQSKFIVPIESCSIAKEEISDFIPELKDAVIRTLPPDYNIANLVVRTGDDGRVFWGGIGRHSLAQKPGDYFWTEIHGYKIFYALDTFFQANLSILPELINKIRSFRLWNSKTILYDLYSGVGLFGISFHDRVKQVVMIEEGVPSIKLAKFNVDYHHLENVEIREGKVEQLLGRVRKDSVAIIDPPRKGLSDDAMKTLVKAKKLKALLYLSCNPSTLVRDLVHFVKRGWKINTVIPFDFFPKTKHIETLVCLKPQRRSKS